MDVNLMPSSYKAGRIVMATVTGLCLYFTFLGAVGLACVTPYMVLNAYRYSYSPYYPYRYVYSSPWETIVPSACAIFVSGGLNFAGFYGAVQHSPVGLLVYAAIHFAVSLVALVTISAIGVFGGGVFAFVAINTTFTLVPLYMVYRIKSSRVYTRQG
ncbi:hypothetical protein HDE_08407 [Halotydeus destructor]|nr:hypothetical protein HDE_08407 [Halotydeus destructor]